MHIDPIPVAVADPSPAPSASSTSGGGPSFGQFLGNAGTAVDGRAASSNSSTTGQITGQSAPGRQTAQSSNDGGKAGGSATKPADSSASGAVQTAQSAPAAGQSADIQPAAQSKSAGGLPSFSGGGRGGKTAGNEDTADGDSAGHCATAIVAPTQLGFIPMLAPIGAVAGTAVVPATEISSNAGKTAIAALIAASADAATSGQASALATGGTDQNGQAPAASTAALAQIGMAGGSDAIPAMPPTGFPTTAQSAALDLAAPARAAPSDTTAPNGTVTAAAASNRGNKASISAQAAALLGRVSVMSAAQASTPAARTIVTGAAGAQLADVAANGAANAAVASPAAPATAPATGDAASAPSAANGTAAAQATPLPPVSGAVDLTAKLSAAAIPVRGDAAATSAAKAKIEPHAATAAAETGSGKSAAAASTDGAAPGAAKPIASAPLAAAPAGQTEDEGASGHAVDATATVPQTRGDIAAAANAAPTIAPVRETAVTPIAALHSIVDQVAIGLKRGVKSGNDQIQINLEPASLGKIAVRLDFAQDGRVSATFSADRPDTLTLLNNDSRSLEQALRDAGLRTDSGSLTFNLSGGDTGAGARQFAQSANYVAAAASMDDGNKLLPLSVAAVAPAGFGHDGSLDIHV